MIYYREHKPGVYICRSSDELIVIESTMIFGFYVWYKKDQTYAKLCKSGALKYFKYLGEFD